MLIPYTNIQQHGHFIIIKENNTTVNFLVLLIIHYTKITACFHCLTNTS